MRDRLKRERTSPSVTGMEPHRIELQFRDGAGASRVLALIGGEVAAAEGAIEVSARTSRENGAWITRAVISNRSAGAVHLDSIWFHLATGLPAGIPARFFKHGYQSWSASHPMLVGTVTHRRDGANFLTRMNHQSEMERPLKAPEAATSEQFTMVESDASRERFFAGFIGAAHQLTTLTVTTPDRVAARALLDGVTLGPGEERNVEPLAFWRSEEGAARMAARWAAMLGGAMNARADAPYRRGWCSWYHYFHAITEEALMANLRALEAMRSEYPLEVVQLDDGFQAALGDWTETNPRFPGGLEKIAREIRRAGFIAGIWTAPFLAARDSRIMREHPGWFIKHRQTGEPLRAGYNPNWTAHQDKFAYALDPGNPEFAEHLERLFRIIVGEFGYDYLKLDFLYAGAAEGIRHDAASLTRAETLRRGLEAIRRGAGDRAFILGCGCPLGPATGIVDGMRIGPDVAPYWGAGGAETGANGTAGAIDAIAARSFLHRRLWLNDPDCLMLRGRETQLSPDEREALAWTIAASGGMLLISDDMSLLRGESAKLYQAVARIGAEVDAASRNEPPLAANLPAHPSVRILSTQVREGAIHLLLNMGESTEQIRLAEILPNPARMSMIGGLEGENDTPDTIELPPHGARLVRTV